MVRAVAPGATPEELQAILAAYGELWPEPVPTARPVTPRWRFSGRWWLDRASEPRRRTSR